jgi:hypothetical protein
MGEDIPPLSNPGGLVRRDGRARPHRRSRADPATLEESMFRIIGLVAAAAVVTVLLAAGFQPDRFRVERSATINAPAERIFPLINDFHRWSEWSPYEKLDPAMRRTYAGTDRGPGAVYQWDGNAKAGQGRMEIVEAPVPSKVAIKLDFTKPITAHNLATFTLVPAGDSTKVTWTMDGPTPYVGKIIHLFFDMDRMVGADFETGLANLKKAAEG